MTEIKATEARIPPEIFSEVASGGGPVKVTRHKQAVYIVNENAIRLLQYLEDQYDIREAEQAAAEIESGEEVLFSLDDIKREIGLL